MFNKKPFNAKTARNVINAYMESHSLVSIEPEGKKVSTDFSGINSALVSALKVSAKSSHLSFDRVREIVDLVLNSTKYGYLKGVYCAKTGDRVNETHINRLSEEVFSKSFAS